MTVCLVTDRRRADPLAQARRATHAGIDLVQIREGDLEAAVLASLVRAVLDVTRGSRTRVVVNDRLDVAIACGADGVHLRADSITPSEARRLAPRPFVVGRSVHSADEARQCGEADYVVAGTMFPTPSKPGGSSWLGEEGLRKIVQASPRPVLAIGGLSADNVGAVARAHAAGVAAIGLFAVDASLDDVVQTLRSKFDTAKTAP
jgi:thiamine-phosphate pyrophosphorylase